MLIRIMLLHALSVISFASVAVYATYLLIVAIGGVR
jgi:hypothetical protein